MKTPKNKVPRTGKEMLERLKVHLLFLERYIQEYNTSKDFGLLGEIAGKLRLLVWKGGRNKPLLVKLAQEFVVELTLNFDRPGGVVKMSLDDYLDQLVYYTRAYYGKEFSYSVMDLITLWAHQSGSAHEDWDIDEKFAALLKSTELEMQVGPYQVTQLMFLKCAKNILNYGIQLLKHVETIEGST